MSDAPQRYGRPLASDGATQLARLEQRFGFAPSVFRELVVLTHNRDHLAIVHGDHQGAAGAQPETVGLVFLRTAMAVPKLTTQAAMVFGPRATRNVVHLARERAEAYLRRETLIPTERELSNCSGPGQVLVGCDDLVLGLAYYRSRGGEASLESLFPRAWMLP
jgi:NOL1/NOP2/fmu family ribosome biogenesis protein